MSQPEYPTWICGFCGIKYGRRLDGRVVQWNMDNACGWCGALGTPVTPPISFGNPPHPVVKKVVRQ